MNVRRMICYILSLLLLICLASAAAISVAAETKGTQTYTTLVTASDFQGGDAAYTNFDKMLDKMSLDGWQMPNGFLFGGDYGDDMDTDAAASANRLMTLLEERYGAYSLGNVVIARGNHDAADENVFFKGLREFDDYLVYTIDYEDFPDGQYWRANSATRVKQTASALENSLQLLVDRGERRPVFVLSHIPLHHSGRARYGENLYSEYIFDVLNRMGERLDLIFLFGHDHSGDYDNYIGGSVNLLRRGERIRIPRPHTFHQGEAGYRNRTLHFTYANYGYVGYTNNAVNDVSVNVLTAGLWEIRPTEIRLYRYSRNGLYSCQTITRKFPLVESPFVELEEELSLCVGEVRTVRASVGNFDSMEYSWTVEDPTVAELRFSGAQAQIICRNMGTTKLYLSVTDGATTKTDSITIRVAPSETGDEAPVLYFEGRPINDKTLYLYDVQPGHELPLDLLASVEEAAQPSWESADPEVATVENGLVRISGGGETVIRFSTGKDTADAQFILRVSEKPKPTFVLVEAEEELRAHMDGTPLTGWHSLLNENGSISCYYFDPATGSAVDGTRAIDGHNYLFIDRVLARGDLCTDERGRYYYWAGMLMKNCWVTIGQNRYFALADGYFAIGLQWVLTPEGDEYAGFVFDDSGALRKDLSGLYDWDGDTYYVNNGALVEEAGLVYVDGDYYFFPGESYAVKNTGYWVYKTNGILPEGLYYFDSYGRMIDPPEIYHTITWIVDETSTEVSYRSGAFPTYPKEDPQKESTAEYEYSFMGWEPECSIAICSTTYTAVFEEIPHRYITLRESPTCVETGWEKVCCEDCGYLLRETVLPATGHRYESRKIPASCTLGGYTLHLCAGCEACYYTNYTAPTGHINLHYVEVPATCTQMGSITFICRCGEIRNVTHTKPTGHHYLCEDLGATHRVSCRNQCGSSYTEAHRYVNGRCICGAAEPVSSIFCSNSALRPIKRILPMKSIRMKE